MKWVGLALLAMLAQGTVLFVAKKFSATVSPLTVLFWQYAGSLAVMTPYLFARKGFKIGGQDFLKVVLSAFLVSTGLSFYYIALHLGLASHVVPLHNVGTTLLPALLGFAFLNEKVSKRVVLGLVFSVLCIVLLTV